MPKSAHLRTTLRARETYRERGPDAGQGDGTRAGGFQHGRLKVSVMALSLSGAGVATMLRKGYSPGRLQQGGARFSLADDTLPASARASPPTFTATVARLLPLRISAARRSQTQRFGMGSSDRRLRAV